MYYQGLSNINEQFVSLARGLDKRVLRYKGCYINGFRFHTKDHEIHSKTHNSGVVVKGQNEGKDIDFYGVLKDIIELRYIGSNKVTLFKCDWWDVSGKKNGIHVDNQYGITSINMGKTWYNNQPYVLASQVAQVFYVDDMKLGNDWHVIQKSQPRSSYDIPEKEVEKSNNEDEPYQQDELHRVHEILQVDDEIVPLERDDILPEVHIDPPSLSSEEMVDIGEDNFINDYEFEEDIMSSDDDIEELDAPIDEDNDSD